ncbi:hypothetical protein ccbrp13_56110 [Ktedonobacteria bacterium brp13]|nr:hypothetical protein ccbrp13_56110 [Ktedonobacteria bacterium brp13]
MTQQTEENKQTEQATFEVVYSNTEEGRHKRRTVRLSHDYRSGFDELYADIYNTSIAFTKIRTDRKPKCFEVTIDEVDALVAALQQFKADCKQAENDEIKRIAEVKAEAFALAEKHGLTLKELSDPQSYQDKYELYGKDGRYINSTSNEDRVLGYVKHAAGIPEDETDTSDVDILIY